MRTNALNRSGFTFASDCQTGKKCSRASRCAACRQIVQDGEAVSVPMVLRDSVQSAIRAQAASAISVSVQGASMKVIDDDATKRQREIADAEAVRAKSYDDYKRRLSYHPV